MFSLQVDYERRRKTLANHSATHILNLGLRKVLGEADQKVMLPLACGTARLNALSDLPYFARAPLRLLWRTCF